MRPANLIIEMGASDEITVHVVDDELYDQVEALSASNPQKDGRFDWWAIVELTLRLLHGREGELTGENPHVLATHSIQTFAPESFAVKEALLIKRIYMIPSI